MRDWQDFAREIDFFIDKVHEAHKNLSDVRGPYPEGWNCAIGTLEEAIELLTNLKFAQRSEEEADAEISNSMAAAIERIHAKREKGV